MRDESFELFIEEFGEATSRREAQSKVIGLHQSRSRKYEQL